MSCKFIVNGTESKLYNDILTAFNGDEELSKALHSSFAKDKEFIKDFGDWDNAYKNSYENLDNNLSYIDRTEDNGEPKLYKNEKTGDWYYLDKDYNKVTIIENKKSLNSLFEYGEIEQITKVLTNDYFKNHLKVDFNNIDLEEKTTSIKMAVIAKLRERIDFLRKSEVAYFEDVADKLETALNENLNEIVDNVKTVFEQNKISYKDQQLDSNEDSELSEMEIIENQKDPSYNIQSNEKNSKDGVTANIKFRLSLIEDVDKPDYLLNDKVYVDFNVIHNDLLNQLKNIVALERDGFQEDRFQLLLNEISKFNKKKPYFNELHRMLSDPELSEEIKNEFSAAFNLHQGNLNTSKFKKDTNGNVEWSNINAAQSAKKENDVLYVWGNNFKNDFVTFNENNKLIISAEDKKVLKSYSDKLNEINVSKPTAIDDFITILRDLGIESTVEGFNHYLDELKLIGNDPETANKIFNKTITSLKYFFLDIENNNIKNLEDAFASKPIFKNLARAEVFYMAENADFSVFTGGKQKWTFSYPSYLSNTIEAWKKDRNVLLNHYQASEFNSGSYKMKWLLALGDTYDVDQLASEKVQEEARIETSKKRINAISLGSFNVFQEEKEDSTESSNVKEINENQYILDNVNKTVAFINGGLTYHRGTTPAEKGTQYEISMGGNISTNARYGGEFGIDFDEEALDVVFEYFDSEYRRMRVENAFMSDENNKDKLSVYYHLGAGNAFKSQLFPSLSPNEIEKSAKDFNSNFHLIYENGNAYLETLKGSDFENDIKRYIKQALVKDINDTMSKLLDIGLFEQNLDSSYKNLGIDSKVWDKYGQDQELKVASDYYINSLIAQVEYSKMFAGDVAYYKNGVDYKKRIPATYTDGMYQRLNNKNKNFNIAVIESVNIASPFHSDIEELVGEKIAKYYKNINSADAQAWITPARWKNLVESLGKWNSIYQSAYDKMEGINDEPFTEKELKKVAQPLKGVYFQNIDGRPVFLKYSQAVLTPRLRKGNDLEKLYNKMVESNVDELLTFDAIKVGSNRPTRTYDDNGNLLEDFTLNPMTLPSNGWKLQQDLPTKTMHATELGSQLQKNIFQGLAFNLDNEFEVNGEELFTGNQMIENIANVVGDLSDLGYQGVLEEFGVDANGKINNLDTFYNSIISELKSRNGSRNVIKALESEVSIYGLPQVQKKLQNIFGSIMTKRILKIQTNGGSFIQMSNYGLNSENADKQNVIWSPNALSTTHEPQFLKDSEGNFILSKNGKKIVRPGGVLISGSFIAKYIPDYKKYKPEELFGYTNEDGEFVKGVIDDKILNNIIGYRIPNQGLSSNDALQIVGILPEENGDTIVAYTGITTKTGSDFDIDKMYIMFPSFNHNKESNNLEYINYDSENKSKEGLQNRLIELYKSVLLNEKVIPDVMTPIDFDFMKNDIRSIHKQPKITNLSLFNPLKDIDTRYGFLAGQAGVGQQANALMAYVLGSMSDLSLTNFNVPNSNNKLDSEYSNNLSSEDIKYYKNILKLTDEQVKNIKSIKIGNSLSAVLNAFVDIAKDPYITEAGWTTMTTNTGNLLLRYGVHPFYVNALLSQTVIQDYVKFSQKYEKSNDQSLSTLDAFIEQEFGKDTYKNYNKSNVLKQSLESLRNQIGKTGSIEHRMNTLYSFLYFQDGSKSLQKSVNATKFMVNGAGKNITSLQISKNAVDSILENEIKPTDKYKLNGFQSLFQNPNGSESMFSKYYKNVVLGVDKIVKGNPKLFLSANSVIQNSFNEIAYDLSNDKLLDGELGDKLEIHAYSYLMSGFKPLSTTIAEKNYLLTDFVKEFEEFQKDNKELYPIIDTLVVKPGSGKIDYITLNNRVKSPEIEESLTNSFSDLLDKEPEFAEKLIKYSFLTSAFAMNPNQFFTHIPAQWMMRNNINRYIIDTNDLYNRYNVNDAIMIDQFYLSNLEDKKLVKNISQAQIETSVKTAEFPDGISIKNNGFIMKKPGKQGYFKVKSTDAGKSYYKLLGYTVDGRGVYTRFIENTEGKYTDIQPLNKKDGKGNRIYGYSRDGIILKPSSPAIAALASKRGQDILNNLAIIPRDAEYQNEVIPNEVVTNKMIDTEVIETKSEVKSENIIQEFTPEKIDSLPPNGIFVFGSNTEGRHGKGAALTAKTKFGAKNGQPTGLQGQSYAIVTKNLTKGVKFMQKIYDKAGEKSVSLDDIGEQLSNLFDYAIDNPSKKFYVTKLGSSLAGYTTEEIRNEIQQVNDVNGGNFIPDNIILPKEYEVREVKPQQLSLFEDESWTEEDNNDTCVPF